jgi:hypothetical protein
MFASFDASTLDLVADAYADVVAEAAQDGDGLRIGALLGIGHKP